MSDSKLDEQLRFSCKVPYIQFHFQPSLILCKQIFAKTSLGVMVEFEKVILFCQENGKQLYQSRLNIKGEELHVLLNFEKTVWNDQKHVNAALI